MIVSSLIERVFERVDESVANPVYYTREEVLALLNKGQRLFCALTHGIERVSTFALTATTAIYSVMTTSITDWTGIPIRVTLSGLRLTPVTVHQLDALKETWFSTAGTPTKYFSLGLNLLGVYPQPAGAGSSLSITHIATPAVLDHDGETPEMPEETHPLLVDFASYALRHKEGGQELQNAIMYLDSFAKGARKYGAFFRSRAVAQGYDKLPCDLSTVDISSLIRIKLASQARGGYKRANDNGQPQQGVA